MSILLKANYIFNAIPIKISMTLHRTRTNNPKIYMEPQKTPNRQSHLKKKRTKLNVSYALISDHTTKLQSSKQYGTATKTDT